MNSTSKTVVIVLAVLVVLGVIFKMAGLGFSASDNVIDQPGFMSSSSDFSSPSSDDAAQRPGSSGSSQGGSVAASLPAVSTLSDSALALLISSAVVRVPQTGVDVTLTKGTAQYSDNAVHGQVSTGRVLAKVATESGFDVFVEMSVTKDGQPAIMKYVALFRNSGQSVSYTSSAVVGDRLTLSSLVASSNHSTMDSMPTPYMSSSAGYNLTLSYLDRKNGEPVSATPTVPETMSFTVKNHAIAK